MNNTKKNEIKNALTSIANAHSLTKISKFIWKGKHGTEFISTAFGFIVNTTDNYNSSKFILVEV